MTPATSRPGRARLPSSGGSVTVLLLVLGPVFLLLFGLVYDGGRAFAAHTRALNLAEQAARQGVQQVDIGVLRAGGPYRLDHMQAKRAAASYLDAAGASGRVRLARDRATGADAVKVTVRWSVPTAFLGLIGIPTIAGDGHASARSARGITTEDLP